MIAAELDALMAGARLCELQLAGPAGERLSVWFTRHDLANPIAMRAAWRRQTGWEMPRYDQEDHDQVVRAIFRVADNGGS